MPLFCCHLFVTCVFATVFHMSFSADLCSCGSLVGHSCLGFEICSLASLVTVSTVFGVYDIGCLAEC